MDSGEGDCMTLAVAKILGEFWAGAISQPGNAEERCTENIFSGSAVSPIKTRTWIHFAPERYVSKRTNTFEQNQIDAPRYWERTKGDHMDELRKLWSEGRYYLVFSQIWHRAWDLAERAL